MPSRDEELFFLVDKKKETCYAVKQGEIDMETILTFAVWGCIITIIAVLIVIKLWVIILSIVFDICSVTYYMICLMIKSWRKKHVA